MDQYPVDDKGNKYSIETEIINIYESDDGTIYEVEYRDMSNGKVENRLIQSGKGTIGFTKFMTMKTNHFILVIPYMKNRPDIWTTDSFYSTAIQKHG